MSIISPNCICFKKVNPDDPGTVKCEVCTFAMHYHCYTGNPSDIADIEEPLCFTCTVNKINPFDSIDNILLHPIILPKKPDLKTGTISGSFLIKEDLKKNIDSGGHYRIFLYCVVHDTRFLTEKQLFWPEGFDISFNNHKLKAKNYEAIDITHFAKLNNNTLIFQYKQLSKNFVVFVLGTKSVQIKDLCENIEKCRQLSAEDSKKKMSELLESMNIDKDFSNLKCTFSASPMVIPVRGKNCKHVSCFDLKNFITYAKTTRNWKCPLCRGNCYYRDLFIDTFIKEYIENCQKKNRDFDEFQLLIDKKGTVTEVKHLKKFSADKTNYFNNEKIEKNAEMINYSPKKSIQEIEMDLDLRGEEERIEPTQAEIEEEMIREVVY